ncbi:MAG: hypothetical protein Q9177_002927, partial [Variospora cf. flavescens]
GVEEYDGGFGPDVEDKKVGVAGENGSAEFEGSKSAIDVRFGRDNVGDRGIPTFGESVKHGGDQKRRGWKVTVEGR